MINIIKASNGKGRQHMKRWVIFMRRWKLQEKVKWKCQIKTKTVLNLKNASDKLHRRLTAWEGVSEFEDIATKITQTETQGEKN